MSAQVEAQLLEWLPKRRWFRAKSRTVSRVRVDDMVPLGGVSLFFVVVEHDGGCDDYVVALGFEGGIHDVLDEPAIAASLLDLFGTSPRQGMKTTVKFDRAPSFGEPRGSSITPRPVTTEQTNSSIIYGDTFVLKILRQLDEGLSPDLEMGEFLTLAGYRHAPALAGTITVERPGRRASTLGVLHHFTPNRGDAWTFTLEELRAGRDLTGRAELLGRRVGEMHTALASRSDIPAFAPEPISRPRRQAMVDAVERSLDHALASVARVRGQVAVPGVHERLRRFVELPSDPIATRVHGDLHLGQVLFTGDDFVLIDFEGEPARPLAHRKAKRPPFVDVAGMIRSFHYAAMTVARETGEDERALAWYRAVREAFLRGWRSAAREPEHAEAILDYCLLEKCVYEVNYEADNRPDWLDIPLAGLIGG